MLPASKTTSTVRPAHRRRDLGPPMIVCAQPRFGAGCCICAGQAVDVVVDLPADVASDLEEQRAATPLTSASRQAARRSRAGGGCRLVRVVR